MDKKLIDKVKKNTSICDTFCCYEDCENCVSKYLDEIKIKAKILMIDEIEKCSEKVFVEMAIDKIMKQSEVSETQAYKIFNQILDSIEFDSEECNNPLGYYSTRYAIMNRVLRSDC